MLAYLGGSDLLDIFIDLYDCVLLCSGGCDLLDIYIDVYDCLFFISVGQTHLSSFHLQKKKNPAFLTQGFPLVQNVSICLHYKRLLSVYKNDGSYIFRFTIKTILKCSKYCQCVNQWPFSVFKPEITYTGSNSLV